MTKFERTKPHVNVGTIGCVDNRKTLLTAALAKVARLESATTPAEVDFARPVAQVISGGVNWTDAEPADFSYLYSSADYATLARQLAEARTEADEAANNLNMMIVYWREATEQAESQLAEATRRVAEVEGLVGRWRQRSKIEASAARKLDDPDEMAWHEGKAAQLDESADELEDALTKEPTT